MFKSLIKGPFLIIFLLKSNDIYIFSQLIYPGHIKLTDKEVSIIKKNSAIRSKKTATFTKSVFSYLHLSKYIILDIKLKTIGLVLLW